MDIEVDVNNNFFIQLNQLIMLSKQEKYFYHQRVFKYALLTSILLFCLIFYLFPRFNNILYKVNSKIPVEIYVSDIPKTDQRRGRPLPPRRPDSVVPIAVEDADLPEEIFLDELPGIAFEDDGIGGIPAENPARPLLEVYPDVSGLSCKGFVRLLLLVNESGKIESVEIVQNSTGSQKCGEMAVEAAKKSQWMPASVDNKFVSSWVEKIYKFNINR